VTAVIVADPRSALYGTIHSKGETMIIRKIVRLTTEAVVFATALALAFPFFLAISSPFISR
jgi:hypothetical protein